MADLPAGFDRAMAALLGIDGWRTDAGERLTYGYDNSRRHAQPDAVALPRDAAQVHALVRACREQRVPVVARGRGTNTTGAAVPVAGGVVVSFERMDQVLEIRPGDRCAIVQPGVLNGDLQRALPQRTRSPAPVTATSASTLSRLAPYFTARGPPALQARLPPTVA